MAFRKSLVSACGIRKSDPGRVCVKFTCVFRYVPVVSIGYVVR